MMIDPIPREDVKLPPTPREAKLLAEIERLREALVRIQDLTQHDMGMSAKDETCVWREATAALKEPEA